MATTKRFTLELHAKEPDQFGDMVRALKIKRSVADRFLDCGEYATLEIQVDADLRIVGGRFLETDE
jgi:hypothetical protein